MQEIPVCLRKLKRKGPKGRIRHVWALRWFEGGQQRCRQIGSVTTMSKREAERERRSFAEQLRRNEVPASPAAPLTFSMLAETVIDALRRDLRPSSAYEFRLAAKKAEAVLGSDKSVGSVTPSDMAKISNALEGSAATRAKCLSKLRSLARHGQRLGLLQDVTAFSTVVIPRCTARSSRVFTHEEVDAMLDAARSAWWRAYLYLAFSTGLRVSELNMLLRTDIDREHMLVRVTAKHPKPFTGSDGQTYSTLEWQPKNHHTRAVPLSPRALHLIDALLHESDGSPYVFLSLTRLGRINAREQSGSCRDRAEVINNLRRDMLDIQRRAAESLSREWTPGTIHDLRRSFASHAASRVPLSTLQTLLGHSSPSTTTTYYTFATHDHAEAVRVAFS